MQKENGNGDKVIIYFLFNHITLIRKYFFSSAYFSPLNLKSLLNQKLCSLKAKFCFCDRQINVAIFSNVIRLHLPPNRYTYCKVNLLLIQKKEENIPEFHFLQLGLCINRLEKNNVKSKNS